MTSLPLCAVILSWPPKLAAIPLGNCKEDLGGWGTAGQSVGCLHAGCAHTKRTCANCGVQVCVTCFNILHQTMRWFARCPVPLQVDITRGIRPRRSTPGSLHPVPTGPGCLWCTAPDPPSSPRTPAPSCRCSRVAGNATCSWHQGQPSSIRFKLASAGPPPPHPLTSASPACSSATRR